MKTLIAAVLSTSLLIIACSDSTETSAAKLAPFPALPKAVTNSVTLSGRVVDWLFEGDAGCFGTLTDGIRNINVYSKADICEPAHVQTDLLITVTIIFDIGIQQDVGDGTGPAYTITQFH
jgi:hypothetical protein